MGPVGLACLSGPRLDRKHLGSFSNSCLRSTRPIIPEMGPNVRTWYQFPEALSGVRVEGLAVER